ncbi:E3 ubiquitin-protein ligase ZNRF3 isoform X1 [Arapaima gigas]
MIVPRRGSDRAGEPGVVAVLVLAALLGAVWAKDTAFVEVVLFESSPSGDYTTYTTGLQGRFSRAGATISAEGEIVQRWCARALCACVCFGGGGRWYTIYVRMVPSRQRRVHKMASTENPAVPYGSRPRREVPENPATPHSRQQ